jgi:hypothetical protein
MILRNGFTHGETNTFKLPRSVVLQQLLQQFAQSIVRKVNFFELQRDDSCSTNGFLSLRSTWHLNRQRSQQLVFRHHSNPLVVAFHLLLVVTNLERHFRRFDSC